MSLTQIIVKMQIVVKFLVKSCERERERELEKEVESIVLLIGRSYWKFYTLVKFYTYRTVMLDILFLKVILFYLAITYCGQMCSVGIAMQGIVFRECTLKMCFTFFMYVL